ncbi:protease modulator HflC [Aestuariivirga sp.]|uniref:protease modulator HflC n=1 Tax=Aestuariivirga sp. TaxID=2650926 RepID=UPI0039E41256
MGSGKTIGLIGLAIVLIGAYMSFFIVDQREMAIVQRFGTINRVIKDPGLYFKVPFADEVVPVTTQMILWQSEDKVVQVVDGRRYKVDTMTVARITDPTKFRQTVGADISIAQRNIQTWLDAALRQTYGRRTFEAALSKDRDVMMKEIRDQVRTLALANGIEIVDVRIRRTDLMDDVLDDTYKRMASEREAEAQDIRSKGEATKTQRMAEADRSYTEQLATARKQSEIIRGEGDADRNKVFAQAYQQDPEFFAFYRSMQAYIASLGDKGTTMVLSPDSDFFRYFGKPTGNQAPAPAQ